MLKVVRGGLVLAGLVGLYALSPVLAWVVLVMAFLAFLFVGRQHPGHDERPSPTP